MNSENNFNTDFNDNDGYQPDYNSSPEYNPAETDENIYSGAQEDISVQSPEAFETEQPVQPSHYSEPLYEQPEPQKVQHKAPENVPPVTTHYNAYNPQGTQVPDTNAYSFGSDNRFSANNSYNNGYNSNQHKAYNPYAPNNTQNTTHRQYNPEVSYNNAPEGPSGGKKNKGMKAAVGVIAACVVIALAVIIMSLGSGDSKTEVPTTQPIAPSDSVTDVTQTPASGVEIATTQTSSTQKDAVWVAEKVRPSVVGVMVYKGGQLSGEGSGVLMSESGEYTYVVTCAHVVDAAGVTYGILLLDGRSFEAELVASDTRTDIAVLKVKQTGLPVAEFGDSSSLKVGETIYAIGNPGGSEYFGSMTDGIVSAIDRSITATYTMTCIQHNAAINPGNSGGALVNSQGQVVGINSSKIASTEYEGMGFAVPTAIAKPVVDALIQYGYVPNRPKLGIEYAPVSSYQLYSMVVSIKGLPKGSLVIAGISEDSTLVNTEAEVGDLIIGVNGKDMDDSSVLLDLIDTGAVGDTLTLTLCRIESRTYKTTTFDVTITLVEDKGSTKEEPTTTEPEAYGGYYYGGSDSFEDFFNDYFGNEFGW